MVVDKSLRGKGYGRKIMVEAEHVAREYVVMLSEFFTALD